MRPSRHHRDQRSLQVRSQLPRREIVPEPFGASEGRHDTQIDRHRQRGMLANHADLAVHLLNRLQSRIEEIAIADADAVRLGESNIVS